MDASLENIMKQYCDDFNQIIGDKTMSSYIVKNSIPIIWFGNLERYQASPVKIVTVGLNPSYSEFLHDDGLTPLSHERFQKLNLNEYTQTEIVALYDTLNAYYDGEDANPYMQFFGQYEKLLHGIDASYFGGSLQNTAIHIDAYSAMATVPRWGELDIFIRRMLMARGRKLYNALVDYLNPDVILISVAKEFFFEIHADITLEEIDVDPKKKGVYILKCFRTKNWRKQKIILGRNFNGTPFGGRSIDETIKILQKMLADTVNTK